MPKRIRARDCRIRRVVRQSELAQRNHVKPPDKVQCAIGDQPTLRKANGDRQISDDTVFVALAGLAVEAGRQIKCDDECIFFAAEPVDLATGAANRIAQRWLRAEAEKAIENYQLVIPSGV